MKSVSVIGLGKLGACIAACFAHKGFAVVGVDVNRRTIDLVNQGRAPVFEPGLNELLSASRRQIRATHDYGDAVMATDATLIVVPTPSEQHGGFSLEYAIEAAQGIGKALRNKRGYHLVVLTSTVLPGSTQYGIQPVLEAESRKRCGEGFGLCYSPEFIALGSVINDFLNPDFLLIGESDEQAGAQLAQLYAQVVDKVPPVARMNFVNAELAKISVNTYVTMKISFANMLTALCEQLPGGDVDRVTGALGLDSRIGPRYLKGAVGYGGPCFPRDNQALAYLARQLGYPATFAEATDSYNRGLLTRMASKVKDNLPRGGKAVILGLSYKPDSNVVEEAAGLLLARRLAEEGMAVTVFDPTAIENARLILGDSVTYASTLEDALAGSALVFVANPDPAYKSIDTSSLAEKSVVIDAWRMFRTKDWATANRKYLPLGVAQPDDDLIRDLSALWATNSKVVE